MRVVVLKSKLHLAMVTGANLDYEGSIAIDRDLMDAVGIREWEKVLVANFTNGNRYETYVITAPAGLEGLFAAMGVEAAEPTHPPADLPESPDDPELARRYGTTALGPEPRWTPPNVRAT